MSRLVDLRDTLISLSFVQSMPDPHEERLTGWVFRVFHHIELDILPFEGVVTSHVSSRFH